MKLTSEDFEDGDMIPAKFTCDGDNISPQLSWADEPGETKSFALSCIDPDAPIGDFVHWLIYDIVSGTKEIGRGGPVPGKEVKNGFGRERYGGPCPPSGTHRYIFTIYALGAERLEGIKKKNFLSKVKENTIDSTTLTGKYSRS
ncbi:MAG: YbhB/YbcL family Raf kinase inhibitor-like protein [Halobacteriota archaeon]|nr:YbhB/YbcL family Raf kinase inhibitor-like protein [Halobacteriota archaeon]